MLQMWVPGLGPGQTVQVSGEAILETGAVGQRGLSDDRDWCRVDGRFSRQDHGKSYRQ